MVIRFLILVLFTTSLFAQIDPSWTAEQQRLARKGDIMDSLATIKAKTSVDYVPILQNDTVNNPGTSGLVTMNRFRMNASDGGGLTGQIGNTIMQVYTMDGDSILPQTSGLLTALYHYNPFTLSEWQGIETGAVFVDGAGAKITNAYGLSARGPTLTNGGTIDNFANIYIPAYSTTGISNYHAILSNSAAPSYFQGNLAVRGVTTLDELTIGEASQTSSAINMVDNGGVTYQFGNGTVTNGTLGLYRMVDGSVYATYLTVASGNFNFQSGNLTTTGTIKANAFNFSNITTDSTTVSAGYIYVTPSGIVRVKQ